MVKHHARVIGIVILTVALWVGVGLTGVATRGAWAEPAVAAAAYTHLGFALSGLERWDEAQLAYEQAVRLAPDDVDARYSLGVALARLDRPEDALREFRQVLRRAPMDADAHYNLGRVLNSLRRHAEAAEAYRAAVRVQPGYANAWGNLGLSAILIGRYGEAREAFERAKALVPGYFESRPIQRHAWEIVSRLRSPDAGAGSR